MKYSFMSGETARDIIYENRAADYVRERLKDGRGKLNGRRRHEQSVALMYTGGGKRDAFKSTVRNVSVKCHLLSRTV